MTLTRRDLIAFAILIAALLCFVPNIWAYFLSDDFVLLSWTHVSSTQGVLDFFDPNTSWFYRPMVKLFYYLGQTLFGLYPEPFHVASLALHGLNGFLVYRLVAQDALGGRLAGLTAGLFFVLNSKSAETVSWIAAIGDLLGVFLLLVSLQTGRRFLYDQNKVFLGISWAAFALALLTRETALTLPLLGVLLVWLARPTVAVSRRSLFFVAGLYAIPVAAYLFIQLKDKLAGGSPIGRGGLEFHFLHLDSILLGILDYLHGLLPLGGILAQLPLNVLQVSVWLEWGILVALALILWRARQSLILWGLLWLLLTPLIFVFFSGPTDRYFYLPSIGYSILIGGALAWTLRTGATWTAASRWRLQVITTVVVLGLLVLQVRDLLPKEAAWQSAGQLSGRIFAFVHDQVPEPKKYSAFFFVDLPPLVNNIPTFQNAMPVAIQRIYDDSTINASLVSCEYLSQESNLPRYSFFFRFTGADVVQFSDTKNCQ